jgi:hypothetical protein
MAALDAALGGEPLLSVVELDPLRILFTMTTARNMRWVSAWTDGQTAAELLDACLGHVLANVRSGGITAQERCFEPANLGHNVPGAIVEVIDLCEVHRFYQGESADSGVLAYALTSVGRGELMTGGPDLGRA